MHQFYYWIKIIREGKKKSISPLTTTSKFVPVKLPDVSDVSDACVFSITYPNQCVLKIHQYIDLSLLNQLVSLCK